jgi:hypothetical protein
MSRPCLLVKSHFARDSHVIKIERANLGRPFGSEYIKEKLSSPRPVSVCISHCAVTCIYIQDLLKF